MNRLYDPRDVTDPHYFRHRPNLLYGLPRFPTPMEQAASELLYAMVAGRYYKGGEGTVAVPRARK